MPAGTLPFAIAQSQPGSRRYVSLRPVVLVRKHRRSQGMNDFIRIVLALDIEPYLKDQAFLNRQAGGRLKGLSKLTQAQKVNSRAEVAQVSVGNVHKVKYILLHEFLLGRPDNRCEASVRITRCRSQPAYSEL